MPLIKPTKRWIRRRLPVPGVGIIKRPVAVANVSDRAAKWLVSRKFAIAIDGDQEVLKKTKKPVYKKEFMDWLKEQTIDSLVENVKGVGQAKAELLMVCDTWEDVESILSDRQRKTIEKQFGGEQ